MPPLSQAQQEAVNRWLSEHNVFGRDCPACGTLGEWAVGSNIIAPPVWMEPNQSTPFIPIYCVRCGFNMMFSASRVGLV